MPDTQNERFAEWAILELMGHRRLAGFVSEVELGGASFFRLDVHTELEPITTQFYSPAAVYCITPATEAIARAMGERTRPEPVHRYELEPPKSLPARDDFHECDVDELEL